MILDRRILGRGQMRVLYALALRFVRGNGQTPAQSDHEVALVERRGPCGDWCEAADVDC